MYLQRQIIQTLLLLIPVLVNAGIPFKIMYTPGIVRSQAELNQVCNEGCTVDLCYLHDDLDCRKFIVCDKGIRGYAATLKICAFGTYWDRNKLVCGNPQTAECGLEYCRGNEGQNLPHPGNCKTFWRCPGAGKGPEPRCCTDGAYFDESIGNCVNNTNGNDFFCYDACPIKQEPCVKGMPAEDYSDGNCKTYYNCSDTKSHPVCCPDGQGFNPVTDMCEPSATCTDVCPDEYRDVCPLLPGSRNNTYRRENGPDEPCPPGTLFDLGCCCCGTHVKVKQDSACQLEFDTQFTHGMGPQGLQRKGNQRAGVVFSKEAVPGPDYEGFQSHYFNGNQVYRVQYFQQAFPNLYINILYRPDDAAPGMPRILLSNCINTDLGAPSLELSLQDGLINLILVTDNVVNATASPGMRAFNSSAFASVPFTPNAWNRYRVVYNGLNVYILNELIGTTQPMAETATRPLQGAISVAAEGLDIGQCSVAPPGRTFQGYQGSIAQLQFTKCLRQEWINSYNAVAQMINRAAENTGMDPSPA